VKNVSQQNEIHVEDVNVPAVTLAAEVHLAEGKTLK
jgi:hypothetical protein